MEFSFLHVADMHLDRPFSGLSSYSFDENLNKLYKIATERSFNNIIDYAIMKNVDFVLFSGDTFDSDEQDFSSKLMLKRGLQRLENAEISVYMICGNHDPLYSYHKNTFNYNEASRIKIIGLNTPPCCDFEIKNKNGVPVAILHALSFCEDKCYESPVKSLKPKDNNSFNIGLIHCDLNADANSPYAPCSQAELKTLNYDYYALGHIHVPTEGEQTIQYAGTIQGRNTKETGVHGIRHIKVSDNNIVKNSFIPTDIIRFEDVTADITDAQDAVDAFNIIEDEISKRISSNNSSCEIFLIRPTITGCCGCFNQINVDFLNTLSEKIKADFTGKVYISQADLQITPKIDDEILSCDTGISGEIYKTVSEEETLNDSFSKVETSLKSFIDNCNFSAAEYDKFRTKIINETKQECRNLCSIIYESKEVQE